MRLLDVLVAASLVVMAVCSVITVLRPAPEPAVHDATWQSDLIVRCLNGGSFLVESTIVQCIRSEVRK